MRPTRDAIMHATVGLLFFGSLQYEAGEGPAEARADHVNAVHRSCEHASRGDHLPVGAVVVREGAISPDRPRVARAHRVYILQLAPGKLPALPLAPLFWTCGWRCVDTVGP